MEPQHRPLRAGVQSTDNNANPDESLKPTESRDRPGQKFLHLQARGVLQRNRPQLDVQIGQITYHNGTISSGTGSTALSLHLDITLKDPAVATTGMDILMKLDNTPNSSGGANEKSADACTLANPVTNYSINIGGVTYTLILKYGTIESRKDLSAATH